MTKEIFIRTYFYCGGVKVSEVEGLFDIHLLEHDIVFNGNKYVLDHCENQLVSNGIIREIKLKKA